MSELRVLLAQLREAGPQFRLGLAFLWGKPGRTSDQPLPPDSGRCQGWRERARVPWGGVHRGAPTLLPETAPGSIQPETNSRIPTRGSPGVPPLGEGVCPPDCGPQNPQMEARAGGAGKMMGPGPRAPPSPAARAWGADGGGGGGGKRGACEGADPAWGARGGCGGAGLTYLSSAPPLPVT